MPRIYGGESWLHWVRKNVIQYAIVFDAKKSVQTSSKSDISPIGTSTLLKFIYRTEALLTPPIKKEKPNRNNSDPLEVSYFLRLTTQV
jgi:hypothetical protein